MGTYQLTINYPDMPVVLKTEAYSENDARSQVANVRGVPLDWVSDVKELKPMTNDKIHPRCPNCGSTAQYRDGQCGCGYTAQKEIREVYIVLANSYAHKGFTTLEEARQFVIGLLADDPVAQQIANDQIYIRVRAGNKNLYEVQSVEVEL